MASAVRSLEHFARPLLLLTVLIATATSVRAQSHFSCFDGTGNIYNATVILTADSSPTINGNPLSVGSEIGVFSSDPEYSNTCVGKMTWQNEAGSLSIWGDDDLTPERDGLVPGDSVQFRIWDNASGNVYLIDDDEISYLIGNGVYDHDEAFVLADLSIVTSSNAIATLADNATTDEEVAIAIDVLSNDVGGNAALDPSSVSIVDGPSNGSIVSIDPGTGAITYLPDTDFSGNDSFTYTVSDSPGSESGIALVQISVQNINDPPLAVRDDVTGDEDIALVIDVLANDSDVDLSDAPDPSSVTVVIDPSNGSISQIDANTGAITYQPDTDFSGNDSFTYVVSDGEGALSAEMIVNVTVLEINDNPTFTSDPITVASKNEVFSYTVIAADVDGAVYTWNLPSLPAWLSFTDQGDGTGLLSGTPTLDEVGIHLVTIEVTDDDGGRTEQSFTITVVGNRPPVATDDLAITPEETTTVVDVLANDIDTDGALEPSTIIIVTSPSFGTIDNINLQTGEITYTPSSGYAGQDLFTYTVMDDSGEASNEATVIISVQNTTNQPVAVDDFAETYEDDAAEIDVLANDSGLGGDALNPSSLIITRAPSHGSIVSINANTGSITYKPNPDFNGSDDFNYRVSDVTGAVSNVVTVHVTVNAVNDAPLAFSDQAITNEDIALVLDVLDNDRDPDGDIFWVTQVSEPTHGLAVISQDEQSISYTPDADFAGTDSLVYTVRDPDGLTAQAIAILIVVPVNDEAVFTSAPLTSAELGLPYIYVAEATDVDGDSLTIIAPSLPLWLTLTDSGNGTLTLEGTPAAGDLGLHEVLLEVTDGKVAVQQRFSIDVNDVTTPLTVATELSLPAYGAMNMPLEPRLSWQPVAGATSYHVQLTRNGDVLFENPVVSDSTIVGTTGPSNDVFYQSAALEEGTRYRWRVRGRNAGGTSPWSVVNKFTTEGYSTTPNEDTPELPEVTELYQNYPNPFNPTTTIEFELPQTSDVTLKVFDIMGREVATLVAQTMTGGRHEVRWDAGDRASGIYLYQLRAGNYVKSKTLTLIK